MTTPFKSYWDALSRPEQDRLAKRLKTSRPYLYQIANGFRNPGPGLAKRMEKETGVHRADLRPDIYEELRA